MSPPRTAPATGRRHRRREPTLAEVERRRWHLWVVAGVLLVAVSLAVALVVADADGGLLPESPALRWAFLGVSVAFLLYVFDQERILRRLTRRLVSEQRRSAELEADLGALRTLIQAARAVNSVLEPEEVFEVLLDSALNLAGAARGAVLLRRSRELAVAVSAGRHVAPPGTRVPVAGTPLGPVLTSGEPAVIRAHLPEAGLAGLCTAHDAAGAAMCAPLEVAGRRVGLLAVERDAAAPPVTDADLTTVALFAEHAATAVANSSRYEQERATVERLVDAAERRSEFVATLVHDLRSPLVAVEGYAQLLTSRGGKMTPEQRERALTGIREQALRLQRNVNEVLQASSAEAGAELTREPVDLAALLTDVVSLVVDAAVARTDGERPVTTAGLARPVTVFGDPEALRHIFINLVENAVKYSPPGTPLEVALEDTDGEVVVRVTDHGPGIPPEELDGIFERFRRSGRSQGGGVGLGLYIVRTLVKAHGGRVWVDSEVGMGSAFHVALPVRSEERARG